MKSPNPYGGTRDDAIARVEALGLRILAERIEQASALLVEQRAHLG
jgi:hypothetical protein